mmetsp:Transcript_7752/g.22061  ORF Transcript_7752/g.22061 Transcript_7752/m.22061 type:complete len:229 (+) Transcript_7752:102-788(+)
MGIRILLLLLLWSAPVVSYSPGCKVSSSLSKETGFESRRGFLSSASAAVLATAPILLGPQYVFAEEDLVDYQDAECKFSIKVPSGWEKSVQSLPDRRKIVLFVKPGSEQKTFVFVAYSPVRSDFTSLGSFGSVDEVAQATILPKTTLAGVNDVESKMLSAESKKQAYFFDYVTKVPQQPETHFRTIFALATEAANGAGNVLVSITAQTPEAEYGAMQPLFDRVIASYS